MRVSGAFVIVFTCIATLAVAQVPESTPPAYQNALSGWFTKHPDYRAATTEDCQCSEEIESMRRGDGGPWAPVPGYQPYFMQGDFDGDGIGDAAVVTIARDSPHKIMILVLIGDARGHETVIQEIPGRADYLQLRGLFCSLPYPKTPDQSCRLLFGTFGSEAQEVQIAKVSKHPRKSNDVKDLPEGEAKSVAESAFLKATRGEVQTYSVKEIKGNESHRRFLIQGAGSYERPGYHWIVEVDRATRKTTVVAGE